MRACRGMGAISKSKMPKATGMAKGGEAKLDISKARSRLDWHPSLVLQDALALTVGWAKMRKAGANTRDLTLQQIQMYLAQTCPKN